MRDGQGGGNKPDIKVTGKGVYGAGTVSEGKGNQGVKGEESGNKKNNKSVRSGVKW